jgi:hypothetical protein
MEITFGIVENHGGGLPFAVRAEDDSKVFVTFC